VIEVALRGEVLRSNVRLENVVRVMSGGVRRINIDIVLTNRSNVLWSVVSWSVGSVRSVEQMLACTFITMTIVTLLL